MKNILSLTQRWFKKILLNGSGENLSEEEILSWKATYNYGIALFHLQKDWAFEHAIKVFEKIIEQEYEPFINFPEELIYLSRAALASTYCALAKHNPSHIDKYCTLAFQQVQKVLENKGTSEDARSLAYVALGLAHLSLHDLDQAILDFHKALQIKSDNTTALLGLGEAYLLRDDQDKAQKAFQTFLKYSPYGGYAAYRLGNIYRKSGYTDQAMEAYKKAPGLAVARLALGKLHLEKKEALERKGAAITTQSEVSSETIQSQKQALETAKRVLAISEQRAAGYTSLTLPVHLQIEIEDQRKEVARLENTLQPSDYSRQEQLQQELDSALVEFRAAAKINRKLSDAWVNIAWTILESENVEDEELLDECLQAARRSLQLEYGTQQEWHRRSILALALIKTKKYDLAINEARKALDLSPNNPQAKYCMALCESQIGRTDVAMKLLQEILRSSKQKEWRARSEILLQRLRNEQKALISQQEVNNK